MKPHPRWQMPLRRWVCRHFGHKEAKIAVFYVKRVRTGTACVRCHHATARDYYGQYPVPRRA